MLGAMSIPASAPPKRVPRAPRPPQVLSVVSEPTPEQAEAPIDWSSWYLRDEDDVGQSPEQDHIIRVFADVLGEFVRLRGLTNVLVGVDAFFAWLETEPLVRVSPDVYLLDDPPSPPWPRSWQVWQSKAGAPRIHPPRFALEVVSPESWRKDYDDNPPKYALLGTRELLIYDPEVALEAAPGPGRWALQQYQSLPDGQFVRTYKGSGPVELASLDASAVVVPDGGVAWLRLAIDGGAALIPTAAERAEAESRRAEVESRRAEAESRRAEAESRRAEVESRRAEAESRRAEAAEAELARLRGELTASKR